MNIFYRFTFATGKNNYHVVLDNYATINDFYKHLIDTGMISCTHYIMIRYNMITISDKYSGDTTFRSIGITSDCTLNIGSMRYASTIINYKNGHDSFVCNICSSQNIWTIIKYKSFKRFIDYIENNKSFNVNTKRNISILTYAALLNKHKIVNYLLKNGADPFVEEDKILDEFFGPFPSGTSLHAALYSIDISRFKIFNRPVIIPMPSESIFLLSKYVSPTIKNKLGDSSINILMNKMDESIKFIKNYFSSNRLTNNYFYTDEIDIDIKSFTLIFNHLMKHNLYSTIIFHIIKKHNTSSLKKIIKKIPKNISNDLKKYYKCLKKIKTLEKIV